MNVDILIDRLTPCLLDLKTGKMLATSFSVASSENLLDSQTKGWNFDWTILNSNPKVNIYKLTLRKDSRIQGLVATEIQRNAVYVHLAESAPHNLGKDKQYDGVGGHLFAIAIKLSYSMGFGGYVYMDAKNPELMKHYQETLGAIHLPARIHAYRMEILEEKAKDVFEKYTLEGDLNVE